jgi:hypothetical protein
MLVSGLNILGIKQLIKLCRFESEIGQLDRVGAQVVTIVPPSF